MGSFSIWHWLIVLLVIILIFGTAKLKNIGKDMGGAIKGFKEGMKDGTADDVNRQGRRSAPGAGADHRRASQGKRSGVQRLAYRTRPPSRSSADARRSTFDLSDV